MRHPSEVKQVLHGNHVTMCQFQSPNDHGYIAVRKRIKEIMDKSVDLGSIASLFARIATPPSGLELGVISAQGMLVPMQTLHLSAELDELIVGLPQDYLLKREQTTSWRKRAAMKQSLFSPTPECGNLPLPVCPDIMSPLGRDS
jgi:hypothetical protein